MIARLIQQPEKYSFFLFGPRGTGKTTLLETWYDKTDSKVLYIDLLDPEVEENYQRNPNLLKEKINENQKLQKVIVDEIQKIPQLLDVIHSCIEKYKKLQFVMTGSSARKIKRGSGNLLGGRAFSLRLHPFTFLEAPNNANLLEMLSWGTLPKIFEFKNDTDRTRFLRSYCNTYLKEEIQLEQIARNINSFRQFLELAAQCSGEILNFNNIASQSGIDDKTVARYFEVLTDTMIGFMLEHYDESVRSRQSQKPKFYLFDTGVLRYLTQFHTVPLVKGSSEYGKLFEQFIVSECFRLNDYFEKDFKFYYLRTKDGAEIDLIVKLNPKDKILIEIKSTNKITDADFRHLRGLSADIKHIEKWVLCDEKSPRKTDDGIRVLPWRLGLSELFGLKSK